jgi:hypothetical protein
MTIAPKVDWAQLTRMPEKVALYDRDVYFREGLRDVMRVWGQDWHGELRRSALLMLKPDGIVAGVAESVCDFLKRQGFAICGVYSVSLSGHVWRAMWRFQLTAASTDRFLVNDLKYRDPGLVLLLREAEPRTVPAVVRLARLKGPSDPSLQDPESLRSVIRQPHRFFAHIHAPDEPADLLREVAILADQAVRADMLQAWRGRLMRPSHRTLLERALREGASKRAFDRDAALQRLERSLQEARADRASVERLIGELRSIRAGVPIDWQTFCELLAESGAIVDPWDVATAGAHAICFDDPGAEKAIGSPRFAAWDEAAKIDLETAPPGLLS